MFHQLRTVRVDLGLTVQELAELSGISVTTITRIERCDFTYKVNEATATALVDALYIERHKVFSDRELSHIGRPPHTGKPLRSTGPHTSETTCPSCHLIVPRVTTHCTECDEPLLALAG